MIVLPLISRSIALLSLTVSLTACNTGIQSALAPDPRLAASPSLSSSPTVTASPTVTLSPTSSPTSSPTITASPNPSSPLSYTDLDKTPPELRPYLDDLLQLGVLPLSNCKEATCKEFQPNQAITRREYSRWLITANNRIYAATPARQIRLAPPTTVPAFTDIPANDADFPLIQGLAETGLIPSRLSGDNSAQFRPDTPLTRADLILWKVPVDTRQPLPAATIATIAAIQTTWGFQDTDKIPAAARPAILMDHKNGDQSNIRRALGYTIILQPQRPTTRAEAAAVLWSFGIAADSLTAKTALKTEISPPR